MKTSVSLLFVTLILIALPSSGVSAAEITVIGQDRRASASSFVSSGEDFDQQQFSEVAPDLGPFDVSLFAQSAIPDGNADALGTQISVIAPGFLRAEGTVSAIAEAFVEEATAYGASQSNVAIRFSLDAPSAFSLVGFVEGSGNGTMTVQIGRPFETVAWYSATDEHIDVNHLGVLEADTYDLNITTGAVAAVFGATSQQGTGAYQLLLTLDPPTASPVVAVEPVRAFPNPFRQETRLAVPAGAQEVRILNAQGRLVRTLAAAPSVLFDGRDQSGRPLAAGVYWAAAIGDGERTATRVVRLR